MINLLLIRDTFSKNSVIGELFINGERICDTLENPWKDNQIEAIQLKIQAVVF